MAQYDLLRCANAPQSGLDHGGNGGANGDSGTGAGGPVLDGGRLAEADAKMGSTTGARARHLGAGHSVVAGTEAEGTDDKADYVSTSERSNVACTESMESEWMVVKQTE